MSSAPVGYAAGSALMRIAGPYAYIRAGAARAVNQGHSFCRSEHWNDLAHKLTRVLTDASRDVGE